MYESEKGDNSLPVFNVYEFDKNIGEVEKKEYIQAFINQIIKIIFEVTDRYKDGDEEKLASRMALLNFFENDGDPYFANKYFQVYGRAGKDLFEETLLLIGSEMKQDNLSYNKVSMDRSNYSHEVEDKNAINIYDKNNEMLHLNDKIMVDGETGVFIIAEEERKGFKHYGYYKDDKLMWLDSNKVERVK